MGTTGKGCEFCHMDTYISGEASSWNSWGRVEEVQK